MLPVLFLLAQTDPLLDYSVAAWRKEPEMRVQDAYKWLFHATLGGEHAISSEDGPRQWLESEWSTLSKPFASEPLVVWLTPDRKILRVNLRPYQARGRDPEMLLAMFVASARQFRNRKAEFVKVWNELGRRLQRESIGQLRRGDWIALDARMRPLGFPAVHHSEAYEKARKPSYRVVLGSVWAG